MASRGRTLTRKGQRRHRIPSRGRNRIKKAAKKAAAARAAEEKLDKIRRRHEKNRSPTREEARGINLGLFGPSKKWQEQQMASHEQAAIDEAAPAIEEQAVQMYINQQNQQARAAEAARQEAIRNSVRIQEAQRLGRERIMYGDDPDITRRYHLRPGERELHELFLSLPLEERQDFLDKVLAPENLTEHQLNAMNVRGFGLDPIYDQTYKGGKRKKRRKSRKRRVKKKTKSKKRKSKKRRRKRRKTRRKK